MFFISIFFGEDVCDVVRSRDVFDMDGFGLYGFADGVISELNVSDGSGGSVFTPLDTGCVVLVDDYWFGEEGLCKPQVSYYFLDVY